MIRKILLFVLLCSGVIAAQSIFPDSINIDAESFVSPGRFSTTLRLLLSVGLISFIPFFLICTTSFLRIVIVLSMVRQAIGTQQAPPNMVIIALAMFLTVFVMTPTINQIKENAYQPYNEGQISQFEMIEKSIEPLRGFMLKYTRDKDLALFLEFSKVTPPEDYNEIPFFVLVPSFVISELKTSFQIGFLLFIPFVVIDLIVSNVLLSLGMFMLSPAMISMPFKILLFVLTDGWNLIIQGMLLSFK